MAIIKGSVEITKKAYDTSVAQQTADDAKQETIEINKTLTEVDKTLTEVDKRVSEAQSKADESLEKAQEGFDKGQEAIDDLANLKIGSNNLLPNSSFKFGFDNWEGSTASPYFIRDAEGDYPSASILEIAKTTSTTQQKGNVPIKIKADTTYTISFDIRLTGVIPQANTVIFGVRSFDSADKANSGANATKNVYVSTNIITQLKTGVWFRLSIQYLTDKSEYIRVIPYNGDGANVLNAQYRRIQVEEGNIATDWSESSFDVDKAVLLVDNKTGAIAGRVTDAEGKITTLTATAEGLQTSVKNKADSSTVTQLADVVATKVSNKDFESNKTQTAELISASVKNKADSSTVTQLADNINLKVDVGDVINQINIDPKGVIISGKKISLDGDVRVLPGFKLAAETIDGGTFNGNSFIKAIDIKTNDGNLPIEIKGKSTIDDTGIIIEQKTKDVISGGIISDSRSILNNGLTVGTALDAANGDRRIDYTKDYSQVSSSGVITPNVVRTSDRALPYWNATGSGDFSKESALIANGISVTGANFYIGVKTEARIVDEKGNVSGQTLTYKPIRASAFTVASSRDVKKNIEDWTGDALKLVNGTRVTEYHLKDENEEIDYKRIGLIVQESPLEIINFIGGDSIDLYEMTSLLWKSVQELDAKNKALEKEKNNLNERLSKIESLLNLD